MACGFTFTPEGATLITEIPKPKGAEDAQFGWYQKKYGPKYVFLNGKCLNVDAHGNTLTLFVPTHLFGGMSVPEVMEQMNVSMEHLLRNARTAFFKEKNIPLPELDAWRRANIKKDVRPFHMDDDAVADTAIEVAGLMGIEDEDYITKLACAMREVAKKRAAQCAAR